MVALLELLARRSFAVSMRVCLSQGNTVESIESLLASTTYQGFPVVTSHTEMLGADVPCHALSAVVRFHVPCCELHVLRLLQTVSSFY